MPDPAQQIAQDRGEAPNRAEIALRQLLETLPVAAYTCDREGLITYFNQPAAALWGRVPRLNHPEDRYCGSFKLFSSNGDPIAHDQCWMALALKDSREYDGQEIVIERADGRRVTALAHAKLIRDDTGATSGALNILVDITDRKRVERELRQGVAVAETLAHIGAALAAELDHEKLLQAITDAATRLSGAEVGAFVSHAGAESAERYVLRSLSGPATEAFSDLAAPRATALFQPTLQRKRVVRLDDVTGHRLRSYMAVPIVSRSQEVVGGLCFGHSRRGMFDRHHELLVCGIASWAAVALENAQLYKALKAAGRAKDDLVGRLAQELRERKLAHEVDARLAAIIDTSDDAIIGKTLQGIITSWNKSAQRIFGYTAAEAIGQHISLIIPESRRSEEDVVLARIGSGERVDHFETERRHKDGRKVDISLTVSPIKDMEGRVIGASKVARDITERKRAEEALAALKAELAGDLADTQRLHEISSGVVAQGNVSELLAQILRAAIDIAGADLGHIQLLDTETGSLKIVTQSGFQPEMVELLDEAIGTSAGVAGERHVSVDDITTHPAFRDTKVGEIMLAAGVAAVHSVSLLSRSGKLVGMLSTHSHSPRRPGDRELQLLDLLARQAADLIERQLYERQLRDLLVREQQAREEAESAGRLKDEFLATLSHELRTPLNGILGWTHMLHSGMLQPDDQRRALSSIEQNARAQAKLIEDLLDVSRIVSGKLQIKTAAVDLAVILASAMDTVRPTAAAKGISLSIESGTAANLSIVGDADRLQQVAWNLLSNAVKFTPSGGRVSVELRRVDSMAEIVVTDTGHGIPPHLLPHVFERFRQGDSTAARRHGGLGLGLAIVRHLIEAHGGTVSAESGGPGLGATFRVHLPLRVERRPAGGEFSADAKVDVTALRGACVLIVDDEPDALNLMRMMLEARGARVIEALSAGQALRIIQTQPFDVLLSDIGMSDHDGYSLIRAVRTLPAYRGRRVPAIAVTAYATSAERDRILQAGYDSHLAKPYDPDQLVAAVTGAIATRRQQAGMEASTT